MKTVATLIEFCEDKLGTRLQDAYRRAWQEVCAQTLLFLHVGQSPTALVWFRLLSFTFHFSLDFLFLWDTDKSLVVTLRSTV